ncbi:MAG: hypothetical protein AB1649_19185 [Chloroflexota bacterium]
MAINDFFKKRKADKYSKEFAALVEKGEIDWALKLYTEHLAELEPWVASSIRAIYHLLQWEVNHSPRSMQGLQALLLGKPNDLIKKADSTLRRLVREHNLAEAVRLRNPAILTAGAESAPFPESQELELLALALLEIYWPQKSKKELETAAAVQRSLPRKIGLPGKVDQVREQLLLWSTWSLHQYDKLFTNKEIKKIFQDERYHSMQVVAATAWGIQELMKGQVKRASEALKTAGKHLDSAQLSALILQWGLQALQNGNTEAAIEWFTDPEVTKLTREAVGHDYFLQTSVILARFQEGKYALGRDLIASALKQELPDDLRGSLLYLQGLSLLAEVRSWESPENVDKSLEAELRLHNRALWNDLRRQLREVIDELDRHQAWQGHLLNGLIAYADSSAMLSMEQLGHFSKTLEHFAEDSGIAQLKRIEGTLVTRMRATDEVLECIQRDEPDRLKILHDEVLAPLGDAIPAQVRAMVFITLWTYNPGYDPIADLQSIPAGSEHGPRIEECIRQVRITNSIRRLRDVLKNPRAKVAEVEPIADQLRSEESLSDHVALALAVSYLREAAWQKATEALLVLNKTTRDHLLEGVAYVRFYASWKTGNVHEIAVSPSNRYLKRYPFWQKALDLRKCFRAIEDGDEALSYDLLSQFKAAPVEKSLHVWSGFTNWFFEHSNPQMALRIVDLLRSQASNQKTNTAYMDAWILFATAIATAQLGRFTACIDACDQLLARAGQNRSLPPGMEDQVRLIKLQCMLALITESTGNIQQQWPSMRRTLLENAGKLGGTRALQAYGFLIQGLVIYLSSDILVEDHVLQNLMYANQTLALQKHNAFLQQIIGNLDWRRKVIADFWKGLQQGDLKLSRSIYTKEIAPVFGERVPHSIQLGMVIIDWDSNQTSTRDLLSRLSLIEQEAPELDPDTLRKVKGYLIEGDQIRHVTKLLHENSFEALIEFVTKSEWAKKGIPVAIAVTLLYAYYKKERMEDAERFAEIISQDTHLAEWVRNYAYLIVGYVYYRKKDFDKSANNFEKITNGQILGHNVDRYWAASHFSRGLEYLRDDEKDEAFKRFRRSIGLRGATQENADLAPLFIHFGTKNIDARTGSQALQAFTLLRDSFKGLVLDPAMSKSLFAAEVGEVLCQALLDKPSDMPPDGKSFTDLLTRITKPERQFSSTEQIVFSIILRKMAICQTLRWQYSVEQRLRSKPGKLFAFLNDQVTALEEIQTQVESKPELRGGAAKLAADPVLLVLQALLDLRFMDPPDTKSAFDLLTRAARLGTPSRAVMQLISEIQKLRAAAIEKKRVVLDLFDSYLMDGTIPMELRSRLVRKDELIELYRLNRQYSPKELMIYDVQTTVDVLARRAAHLICAWSEGAKLRSDETKASIQVLRDLITPDGKLDPKTFENLEKIMAKLKPEPGKIPQLLSYICAGVVELKKLESSVYENEQAVMQELIKHLQQ